MLKFETYFGFQNFSAEAVSNVPTCMQAEVILWCIFWRHSFAKCTAKLCFRK